MTYLSVSSRRRRGKTNKTNKWKFPRSEWERVDLLRLGASNERKDENEAIEREAACYSACVR